MTKSSLKNPYRPDIDGLRTIAVLAVVLYHAGFSAFKGGFVGVDVFFVISGFLITRILTQEIEKTGRINFGNFYLRRARRLLPALFFTLLITTFIAIYALSSQALQRFGASLLHSVLSISNIFFFSESGYFDTDSHLKPLLHTWSLAVEEQFYIIWPLILLPLVARNAPAKVMILLLGSISLISAQILITTNISSVFFLMPFRIFEFSIGASLVWLKPPSVHSIKTNNSLLLAGLGLIAYSIFFFDEKTVFPGLSALIPCIGTFLCIYANNPSSCGKLINNKLFVSIGLISYSLYLSHWPIIVFYKIFSSNLQLLIHDKILITALSIATAYAMYFLIEKPFRQSKTSNSKFLAGCLIFCLLLCYVGASIWAQNGWTWRPWVKTAILSNEQVKQGMDKRFQTRRMVCERKGWSECDLPESAKTNVLIIGDSHAVDALTAFERLYPYESFSVSEQGGCPPYNDIERITLPTHPDREKCKLLNLKRYDVNYLKQYDYIVINVLYGWYTPEHLKSYLEFLHANEVNKVIVLGGYLVLKKDLSELVNQFGQTPQEITKWLDENTAIEKRIKTYTEDNGFLFISKRETFCGTGECAIFDKMGIPFTYDQHHLTYEFSSRLAVENQAKIEAYLTHNK